MSFTDKRVKKKRRWGKVFEYSSYERSLPVDKDYTQLLKELEDEYSKKKTGVVVTAPIASIPLFSCTSPIGLTKIDVLVKDKSQEIESSSLALLRAKMCRGFSMPCCRKPTT